MKTIYKKSSLVLLITSFLASAIGFAQADYNVSDDCCSTPRDNTYVDDSYVKYIHVPKEKNGGYDAIKVEKCTRQPLVDNKKIITGENKNEVQKEVFLCPDNTITFKQPKNLGILNQEGLCGQTAAANVTAMICKKYITPETFNDMNKDVTPGSTPKTLAGYLNQVFNDSKSKLFNSLCAQEINWGVKHFFSRDNFLTELKKQVFTNGKVDRLRSNKSTVKINPIPVLMSAGGLTELHWGTIVDITKNPNDAHGCDVFINMWDNQYQVSCTNFLDYANYSNLNYTLIGVK